MSTAFVVPSVPDQAIAKKKADALIARTADLTIRDEDDYIASWPLVEQHDLAIQFIRKGDGKFPGFDGFVAGLDKLHKMAIALRSPFVNSLQASKDQLLLKRGQYREEQDRIARKKAAEESVALLKQQQAELAREAKKLEKVGEVEAAAVLREEAKTMPAPAVAVEQLTRSSGSVSTSVLTPKWEVVSTNYDMVPIEYKTLDPTKKGERDIIDSKIRTVISKLGNAIKIPGVEVRNVMSESSRAVR